MKRFFCIALALGVSLSFAKLSEDVKDNFISSCEDNGSSPKFCSCVFNKVEQKYSQQQIDAIELKMRRGHSDLGYSEFVKKASKECNAQISSGASLGALAASEDDDNAQNVQLSADDMAALEAMGIDAAFAEGFMNSILSSPEYKNVFLADCAVEFAPYLGMKETQKSCECSYRKLVENGNMQKLLSMIDENGKMNESAAFDLFLPCLPKNYTSEMEKFMMDSCQTVASKNVCTCIVKDVKSHFTLQELIRNTLKNPNFIQGYSTGAAMRCKDE